MLSKLSVLTNKNWGGGLKNKRINKLALWYDWVKLGG